MKNITTSLLIFTLISFGVLTLKANDDKYITAMKRIINTVYTSETDEAYQEAIDKLERVAAAKEGKWEPYYYATFAHIMRATRYADGKETKDLQLDKAQEHLKKALKLNPKESELHALEGFIHMIRLSADPGTRGRQYSGMSFKALNKAIAMNPDNPRALYLMAQMQMGTAKFMGEDLSSSCATLEKSLEKFEEEKVGLSTAAPLMPRWGHSQATGMKEQCR